MFFVVLLLFLILIFFYYVYCTLLSLSIVLLHVCIYVTGRPCCKSLCLDIIIIIMYYTYYDIYVRILSFLVWTDATPSNERISELKPYQRINHFPGMGEICRKDSLARNMAKYD